MSRSRSRSKSASSRRSGAVVRITTPAALVGVGGLLVSGIGVADAATGGNFLLGKSNTANRTTVLTDRNGTPLSLRAKAGSPPLKVNSKKLVAKLNANFLNGLSSAQLQRRIVGSCPTTGIGVVGGGGGVGCSTPEQIVFTSNGTFTVPAGITHLTGDLWGAGGGGGSGHGGAGSGAFESVLLTVTGGDVVHVTVGQGGGSGGLYASGTAGGDSFLSINSGSVIAEAGGGAGGFYPCQAVAGGTAATPTGAALGIETRPGDGGDCDLSGKPGFIGFGGTPYGGNGGNGVVILSVDH